MWFRKKEQSPAKGVTLRSYQGSIVVVIDVSGSMSGVFEQLHDELCRVREVIKDFRLVVFADKAKETSIRAFRRDSMAVGGGTELVTGLELATSMKADRIVVMSDGFTMDEQRCLDLARSTPATVHAIGTWPNEFYHQPFMPSLAEAGGGIFCPVHEPNDFNKVNVARMRVAMGKTIGYTPVIIEEHHAPQRMPDIGVPQRIRISAGSVTATKINIVRR